ncbi:hypothetical protein CXK94_08945 [Stutzerimonas stutzeri]|uniref:Uncharacterized protein n=1 Tax=Stutzerimonas stutzeri TaxID=316 RepID=A0A2N8T696_STUST|nr:hypothetical protein CXK94_08945 [Stutzerimonas stutzeri]
MGVLGLASMGLASTPWVALGSTEPGRSPGHVQRFDIPILAMSHSPALPGEFFCDLPSLAITLRAVASDVKK